MPRSPHDQAIVVRLLPQLTTWSVYRQRKHVTYNRQGRVSRLDLTGLGLIRLFPEIGQLSQLQELHLKYNQLTSLPGELGQLPQLQKLYLHVNQLTSVPGELGQLLQLRELHLYSNQLTSVPEELGQLSQLQVLDLSGNQLTSIPMELGWLTQLKSLDLINNPNLHYPPPNVINQGVEAVLTYLRSHQSGRTLAL
ncbi:leucine-rich repeat domain-containing protein [Ktedonospora formicarum]|uniref:Disease resistance R13L4/SHOC-2-like LRR domain-containing protein n=1 Tax=Ktedonospora formicarum TaxID=2778364 RepID=A0A8J3I8V8_9CHLR|nr:leucine-rich repeat domain-containing protein [Ktedonospora formicarum]GHO47584.1 hypothetical protein KSX_57470 [Ktedonospora formicarum]